MAVVRETGVIERLTVWQRNWSVAKYLCQLSPHATR
jgi:hypothetical protein